MMELISKTMCLEDNAPSITLGQHFLLWAVHEHLKASLLL